MREQAKTKSKCISYVVCKNFVDRGYVGFDPICGHFDTLREAERALLDLQYAANARPCFKDKYAHHLLKPGEDIYIVRSEWTRIAHSRRQVHPRKKAA